MNVKEIDSVFNPDFIVHLLSLLNQFQLIDDISLRNALIRKEWLECKQRGLPNKEFIIQAADKFCLSEKAIESILYRPGAANKKSYDSNIKELNNRILYGLSKPEPGN